MIFEGSWNALTYSQANPAIAVAPLPKGKTRASANHALANVIWTGSQNQCAALEWVKYLASADAERILGETGTVIPAMERLQERLDSVDSELWTCRSLLTPSTTHSRCRLPRRAGMGE